jgi:arginyl-tRNA--protein-N-Asp/Glu arginylyltransferase
MQLDSNDNTVLRWIVDSIHNNSNLVLNNNTYKIYDRYIEKSLKTGDLIKHSKYNFTGFKLANIINGCLSNITSNKRIQALGYDDDKICTQTKGQGVYFMVTEDDIDKRIMILLFTCNAIIFCDERQ